MMVIESLLGNVNDPAWKARLENAQVDLLTLDQWQAQKNRFRRKTEGGVELAVSLERNVHLRDGDVLIWDDTTRHAVVARIQLQDVMIVRLEALLAQAPEILGRTCLEIGHALGNQHWPAVVKGTAVYVPLTVSQQVMSSVMKTHAFPGITYEFAPGDTVIPYLSPHEARQLFGGANATPHSHIPGEMRYDTVHAHETGHLPVPPHVHGRRHSQGNDHDH